MSSKAKKITLCIPTYWTNETGLPVDQRLSNIYDHPTPINTLGTIERVLNSVQSLDGDFNVVVIGMMTDVELRDEFQKKLKNVLSKFKQIELYWFSHQELNAMHNLLDDKDKIYQKKFVSLDGYSNIRNLCLILPRLLGSDLAVLIDDDEVFNDKNFVIKANESMNELVDGEKLLAKTGIYDHEEDEKEKTKTHWSQYPWPKKRLMDEVFDKAKEPPRLKESSWALGGAMVVHKDLFCKVSFDPWITRGEDIDYLINCKLHGFRFYSDNELRIMHLPPEKISHTLGMRQDIYRFVYEKEKLDYAFEKKELNYFDLEELEPFPGRFLKKTIKGRALGLSILAALRDFYHPDIGEHLKLVRISVWDAARYAKKNKSRWFGFQKLWPTFMEEAEGIDVSQVLTRIN